jgi:ribosomal protein S18 acetylase RimI-like enzyme
LADGWTAAAGDGPVTLHRVRPDDWRSHRDLRLEMLLDAPDAFWTQHADVVDLDEAGWRARIASAHHVQVRIDGVPVGSAGLYEDPDEPPGTATLVAMYVTPHARGRGVGRRLVEAVLAEAEARGSERVVLEVTGGNAPAIALYERMGFRLTGRRRPHPRRADLVELDMERDLRPAGPTPTPTPAPTRTRVPRARPDVEGCSP